MLSATKIIETTKVNGGLTMIKRQAGVDVYCGRGFIVACNPGGERDYARVSVEDILQEDRLASVIGSLPNESLFGTWLDGNDIVVDLVKSFNSMHEAMKVAARYDQKAIFDLDSLACFDVQEYFRSKYPLSNNFSLTFERILD